MSKTELTANVFRIENVHELTATYSQFRVRGLDGDHEVFYRNRSQIEYALRRATRSPACVYEDDMGLVAAVSAEADEVPSKLNVVRATVRLDSMAEERELDFSQPSAADIPLCLNVLHFHFQEALDRDSRLWQPGSGQPVFFKKPQATNRTLNLFRGMAVRPCTLNEGGFGIVVDVKHRYVHRRPLPSDLDRNAFRAWKGRKFIYHFGENWYEIRVDSYLGLSIGEVEFPTGNGKMETLFDYVLRCGGRPLPKELTSLSPEEVAVAYFNGQGDQKSVPASLCFANETSEHSDARRFEAEVKLRPAARKKAVTELVRKYLTGTRHNGMKVAVCGSPLKVRRNTFAVPDLLFGNGTTLSTQRKSGVYIGLKDWGRQKRDLLMDKSVGFVDQEPLGRQYLVLPKSVAESYGAVLRSGLCRAVDDLFPQETGFNSRDVTYDDRGCRTVVEVGSCIIAAVEEKGISEGHGLVVVPRIGKRNSRSEDELAALVVRELYDRGLTVAVSHTDVPNECLVEKRSEDRGLHYVVGGRKRGKWNGYLRGLALNKVLLTNERWPFAFTKTMHSDLSIGIDVKNNTAGFVLMGPDAKIIRMHCATSRRKERLSEDQLETELYGLIASEASHLDRGLQNILIMRDGRLYEEEIRGVQRAFRRLGGDLSLGGSPAATLLEIHKTSSMSLRLFDIFSADGRNRVRNPKIGDYYRVGDDAFLATTGWPFDKHGTARPLHVKYVEGPIAFENALEDVFWQSCLTFTKPDDCSTVPISLRLLDRRLREEAGEYDEDALRYSVEGKSRASA